MKKKVCIVIGHHKFAQGAYNADKKLTEFTFSQELARYIKAKCPDSIDLEIVYREPVKGSYLHLPAVINELDPDFIVSLHCNAYNKKVSGTETLHHYNSKRSKIMAQIFQDNLVSFLGFPDRGLKLRRARKEQPEGFADISTRGGHLLKYTDAPCIITEAFFIDNTDDLLMVMDNIEELAQVYINSILEVIQKI